MLNLSSIQPYLAGVEKKWIAFQLLTCLRDARTRKVRPQRHSSQHGRRLLFHLGGTRRHQVGECIGSLRPQRHVDRLFILIQTSLSTARRPFRIFLLLRHIVSKDMLHRPGTLLLGRLEAGERERRKRSDGSWGRD